MRADTFERGHWFNGRIYERRSDLSPDGELLVYFASKWGGGLFTAERVLRLNHRPDEATPHPDQRPRGLTVEPDPEARGENDPLYSERLTRDGWVDVAAVGGREIGPWKNLIDFAPDRPEPREAPHRATVW